MQDRIHKNNLWLDLIFNIFIPVFVMSKLNSDDYLGAKMSVCVALLFPILYGLWELKCSQKVNPMSVLGVISVLLTGGIALLELDAQYIAIKEATIPALLGLVVIISCKLGRPLIHFLLLNKQLVDVEHIYRILDERQNRVLFDRVIERASWLVAGSFFLSSALNYLLATFILKSSPGTSEYTAELGKMTALSYPIIALPSTVVLGFALWYLFAQIKQLTGLKLDQLIAVPKK